MEFYKESLALAEREIYTLKHQKALKDVIGKKYENHRGRIWKYFGFDVTKDRHGCAFDPDWTIFYNDKLIAFEEDKDII